MAKQETKETKVFKRTDHVLLSDFPTQKKKYLKGDKIALTKEGAEYLRTLKKIK